MKLQNFASLLPILMMLALTAGCEPVSSSTNTANSTLTNGPTRLEMQLQETQSQLEAQAQELADARKENALLLRQIAEANQERDLLANESTNILHCVAGVQDNVDGINREMAEIRAALTKLQLANDPAPSKPDSSEKTGDKKTEPLTPQSTNETAKTENSDSSKTQLEK